jgi:hypothetical protein
LFCALSEADWGVDWLSALDDTEVGLWLGIQDLQEFIAWVRGEYSQKSWSIGINIAFSSYGLSE